MLNSRNFFLATLLLLGSLMSLSAAVPDKPTQKLLLWDYANIIDSYQKQVLADYVEPVRNVCN